MSEAQGGPPRLDHVKGAVALLVDHAENTLLVVVPVEAWAPRERATGGETATEESEQSALAPAAVGRAPVARIVLTL